MECNAMSHRQLLYKANALILSPKNCKRKIAHDIRATKRSELYSLVRNIRTPSPTPRKPTNFADEQKENCKPQLTVVPLKTEEAACSRQEPGILFETVNTQICEKLSRKKAYLMRYLAWKEEKVKKAQLKDKNPTVAPFVVPIGAAGANDSRKFKKSFAPKNHVFHPPANLKGITLEIVGMNSIRSTNGVKHETYHFVETPKKQKTILLKAATYSKGATPSKHLILKAPVHKTPSQQIKKKATASATEQKASVPNSNAKKTLVSSSRQTRNAGINAKQPKSAVEADAKSRKTPARSKPIPPPQKQAPKLLEKPQPIVASSKVLPPKQAPKTKEPAKTLTVTTSKASARLGNCKKDIPSLKRTAFKASKKPSSSISTALLATNRSTRSNPNKLNAKTLLQNMLETAKLPDPIPVPPKNANKIPRLTITTNPSNDCFPKPAVQIPTQKIDKFNFVRYSIVQTDVKDPDPATPEKAAEPPTTYLSPYVSVSRGKVNTKIEREKRNSVYMVPDNSLEMKTTVQRTLATVRYYRKQLMEEIDRLNDQCHIWQHYQENNAKLIEDGVDMIVVTIGQTRLLTSKKLKQFGGLIDRCEAGVLGTVKATNDGSEGTKPILPEDLEGFWSMVSLQIENVDKRFAQLERWKANNWTDPDAVLTTHKSQTNVRKPKKCNPVSTARPNEGLQKMLKSAHAAYLNKKAAGRADEDVILTPSKSRRVLIKDRRSRSAAATVITVNSPRPNQKSPACETVPVRGPKLSKQKSPNLLKNTLLKEQEKKSPVKDCLSPIRNQQNARKSILKTPGSKCKPKSVVFNSPSLNFTIEYTIDETEAKGKSNDETARAYKLRNRRVVLRDSAEFTIPK